jgi:hypothetical protein
MPNPQPRVRTPRRWKTPTWGADSLALDADGSTEAWGSGSEGQVTRLPAESGFNASPSTASIPSTSPTAMD